MMARKWKWSRLDFLLLGEKGDALGALVIIKELLTWRAAADILMITKLSLKPDSVMALLPGTEMDNPAPSITTTPIYLESLKETTTLFCKIIAPPAIQPMEKRWPDVEITVEVEMLP